MLNTKKLLTKILQCDYIVEQGTKNNWTYRKWNSGIAECWMITTLGASSGNVSGTLTFPFSFANTDYNVQLTAGNNVLIGSLVAENNYSNGTRERTVNTTKISVYKTGNAYTQGINAYVIGNWK